MKHIDDYSYHCGVMDAFAEIVGAQVKKMALSHPFTSREEMRLYHPYAKELCKRYEILCYEETELLMTDLFPISMNKGKCNIIFVNDEHVWNQYCHLKQKKLELIASSAYCGTARRDLALSFGNLLSYSKEACLKKISENKEIE